MRLVLTQFWLLLWKNYVLQKRKIFVTVLEIGLPTLFALILIFIRERVETNDVKTPTEWPSFSVDDWPSKLLESFHDGNPKIAYAPTNELTKSVMRNLEGILKTTTKGCSSGQELENFLLFSNSSLNNTSDYIGGVVFNTIQNDTKVMPQRIWYTLRLAFYGRNGPRSGFQSKSQWRTDDIYPLFQTTTPREKNDTYGGSPGYYREGFLTIQRNLDKAIILHLNKSAEISNISLKLKRMLYPPYYSDPIVLIIQLQLPLIIMLSFVFSALQIVKDVVHEKERRLKESLKMMGVSGWLQWSAWFTKYFVFLLISVFLMVLFLCIHIPPKGSVIGNSDPTLVFVFLMLYAVATIAFCFAVSVFFAKANAAAAAGGILFFVTYIPYFFLQPRYSTLSFVGKILPCLVHNIAMAYGGQVIGMFEGTGSGSNWSNFYLPVSVDDNLTLLHIMLMFIVDTFLYILIAWYIEAVFPGEYGVPQKWYFPFLKAYWCGESVDSMEDTMPLLLQPKSHPTEYFQKDPVGLKVGVKIDGLRKEFVTNGKKKVAVAGMNLNMYEGQITALLGHNGAGKTTTMSMLTGFIPCTSGTAYVNGHCINKDIASVRKSLGLCPQHDILFDTLTVEEHLYFFAKLKGFAKEKVPGEIDRLLQEVGLTEKRGALAKTLSGGQKRKLSVASALIGDSKVVVLDEPSSGMDPSARRHIWDVLQKFREGRTLLLSTHFMDEADVLGDRIAIMAGGVIKCCGTSLFLKNKYGAGYHMVIVKLPECDVDAITEVVTRHVPSAYTKTNVSAELTYVLPQDCSAKFEDLFSELEERREELRIGSFGASVTTMEEVFMKVGEQTDDPEQQTGSLVNGGASSPRSYGSIETHDKQLGQLVKPLSVFSTPVTKNTGVSLYLQQFRAMFIKRVLNTFRNKLLTISQLAVPLFFTIAALIVVKTLPTISGSTPLDLTLAQFNDPIVTYAHSGNAAMTAIAKLYANQFGDYQVNQTANVDKLLLKKAKESLSNYNNHYVVAATFNKTKVNGSVVMAQFNNQPYHAAPVSLSLVDTSLLRYYTGGAYSVEVTNHPLPKTTSDEINTQSTFSTEAFTISFNVLFGMSFLASSFVLFIVRERSVKSKHVQFVSGVHAFNFWASTFTWDFINFLVPTLLLMVTFAAFQIEAYVDDGRIVLILLLFLLYGWAMLPFMYLLSFIFTVPATGLVWLTVFNIITGSVTVLAVLILAIPQLNLLDVASALKWTFFVLLPNFGLGQGLQDFYSNYEANTLCSEIDKQLQGQFPYVNLSTLCSMIPINIPGIISLTEFPCCAGKCGNNCLSFQSNYLAWEEDGIGRSFVFLALQGLLYFAILFLLESDILRRVVYLSQRRSVHVQPEVLTQVNGTLSPKSYVSRQGSITSEDTDVINERNRVLNESPELVGSRSDVIVLRDVTRYFGPLTAVDHISVGIPRKECFGLLGVNGAGKTTTFKMLTGDEFLSEGDAFMNSYNIKTDIKRVQQSLGYCPQFDALIDLMTVRETLYMFARLRGVKEWQIRKAVWELVQALLLEEHVDKLAKDLSGGNKRKLSTAIALTGDPPIVFLDEPSTGMDPVARRHLWDVLTKVRASGRTLVLTSHSMEECEALCTRIAIMVNGVFKCLGSTQHLKNKFGDGYTIIARVGYPEEGVPPDLVPLQNFIQSRFPESELKDIHEDLVHYHVPKAGVSWATVFGVMERAKTEYNIEDYSVSQTTLEQVFLNFARAQVPPSEHSLGCCSKCSVFCRGLCQ